MEREIKKILSSIRSCITYDIMNIRQMDRYIRDNLSDVCSSFCEIGVRDGYHAKRMLLYHNVKSLYLIDPVWTTKAIKKFDKYPFVTIIKGSSKDVFDKIPVVDVIYVDGDHTYKGIKNDLKYFDKARVIFGGHDFTLHGIHVAVMEFCVENDLVDSLIVKGNDWWIVKKNLKNL